MRDAWVDWRRVRGAWRWLGAAALLLFFALLLGRDWLSLRLVPDPRMNQRIEQAQAALSRGHLSGSPDAARELFETVLATDPDQMVARQGLVDVRNAALARAQFALDERRPTRARRELLLARQLSAPAVQWQALHARLQDMERGTADIEGLLARAGGPGVDDREALLAYNRVLQLDADNVRALQRRRELFAQWLARAQSLLADGDLREAQRLIDVVVEHDPAHLELPPTQAEMGEALARQQREHARMLATAQAETRRGRLETAAVHYLQLREQGFDAAQVDAALGELAALMAARAERQAADFKFAQAEQSLAKARGWSPQHGAQNAAAARVRASRQSYARLLPAASAKDRARIPGLLADAEQAMARGDFITPPGTSAWDRLRVASSIRRDAPEVLRLQQDFVRRSRGCFEQAMTQGQLRRAQSCLEAALGGDPAWKDADSARERMAERWIAHAQERIGASDDEAASRAIVNARRWQPLHPMLDETAARLRRSKAASR